MRRKAIVYGKGKYLSEFCRTYTGKKNHAWKGDRASYRSLHFWVERWKGKPNQCGICGTEEAKRFDWASKSKKYLRDLSDWIRLCRSCHVAFDESWLKRSRNEKGQFIKSV